ncbi:hypothetical protein EVA_02400 [gut metagenome]|uniref:Uncharacterized protein n=1 Tax=gut metagenome TaxID=749906 RepID=J9H185_9ZZZZ
MLITVEIFCLSVFLSGKYKLFLLLFVVLSENLSFVQ